MARIRPLVLIPPVIFAALAGLLLGGLMTRDGDDLPSALIGKPAPGVPAENLPGQVPLTTADLAAGSVTLVNFWASWCPPCRAEHPTLLGLAGDGLRIAGINIKDDAADAAAYLAEQHDPFFAGGFDPAGRTALDWGVTAPPETFIVAGDGTILFRFAGPLIGADFEHRFMPALQQALAGAAQ